MSESMDHVATAPPANPTALPATTDEITAWAQTASPDAIIQQASWWLRRLATTRGVASQMELARDAELEMIQRHYAPRLADLADRDAHLERCLQALAPFVPVERGKKSASLAYGQIGVKSVPAKVSVVDQDAAVAWAEAQQHASAIVTTRRVDHRQISPLVLQTVAETGEQPDGFDIVAAHEAPVVKPNSRAMAEPIADDEVTDEAIGVGAGAATGTLATVEG